MLQALIKVALGGPIIFRRILGTYATIWCVCLKGVHAKVREIIHVLKGTGKPQKVAKASQNRCDSVPQDIHVVPRIYMLLGQNCKSHLNTHLVSIL